MPLETATALDIESLNKPDDSAHGVYNATTLKNADDYDDDGHVKRTGTISMPLLRPCLITSPDTPAVLIDSHLQHGHAL